ncbi:MAG: hypothetical protein RI973_1304, partial [Bacteroidota bacterium]
MGAFFLVTVQPRLQMPLASRKGRGAQP